MVVSQTEEHITNKEKKKTVPSTEAVLEAAPMLTVLEDAPMFTMPFESTLVVTAERRLTAELAVDEPRVNEPRLDVPLLDKHSMR